MMKRAACCRPSYFVNLDPRRLTLTPQTFSRSTLTILLFSTWSAVDIRRRPFYSPFHHALFIHQVCYMYIVVWQNKILTKKSINKHQHYYLDLTNQFGNLAKWKLEAIWLLPNVLSTSTCLHALLLTFLRLLCLEMPLKYKQIHIKVKTGEQLYWTIVVF